MNKLTITNNILPLVDNFLLILSLFTIPSTYLKEVLAGDYCNYGEMLADICFHNPNWTLLQSWR